MKNIYSGNADTDGKATRGWLIGDFIADDSILHSEIAEIKWGNLTAGEARTEWAAGDHERSVAILVSGRCVMKFRDTEIILGTPGDYAVWAKGVEHKWIAEADSTVITIRWCPKL